MKKIIRLLFLPALLLAVLSSCERNGNKVSSKECVDLNNEAFKHLNKYTNDNGDIHQLDTALFLLKKAVECDSTYLIAYLNMRVTYGYMAKYSEAIAVDNKMISLRPKQSQFIFDKALLFDKINETDSAVSNYRLIRKRYQNSLGKDTDKSETISQIILLTALIDGKDKATTELAKQIKTHPELLSELTDTTILGKVFFLKNFDRMSYVKDNIDGPMPPYDVNAKNNQKALESEIQIATPAQNPTKLDYKLYHPQKN